MTNATMSGHHHRTYSNEHSDWIERLDAMPDLPGEPEGDWYHAVQSGWLHGIWVNDGPRVDCNTHIELSRIANNESRFGAPVLDYEIRFQWGSGPTAGQATMDPEAAMYLGRHLVEAATAAMRDRTDNTQFLVPAYVERVTDEHPPVTADETRFEGRIAELAKVTAGDVTVEVERFDEVTPDGTPRPAEWLSHAALLTGHESNRLDVVGDSPEQLRRRLSALAAAASAAVRVLDEQSSTP